MIIQNLNGTWKYRIGKGKEREIEVPFSALPVGHSECSRMFDLEHHAETRISSYGRNNLCRKSICK